MFPPSTTAASLLPSLEDVMLFHCSLFPTMTSVQETPESVEVQIFPSMATAASLLPSLEDVIPYQFFVLATEVSSVAVSPKSVEVQMFPPSTTAASLLPSLEDVMLDHPL